MNRKGTRITPLAWLLGALCASLQAAEPDTDGFVGTAACTACHASEAVAWKGSHHDLAMQHATADTVLGDFDDATIEVHGVTSRFFRREGKFFVNTDGRDGQPADFEIAYTFGVTPLQQYLVAFPDGRLQALPLAWDARPEAQGGQRWFHLYPIDPIRAGDELHWTGLQQNWNYMCADCHSTNLKRGYDAATDRFDTTWTDVNVGCEACHGPGRTHVDWATLAPALRAEDVDRGLKVLQHDRRGVSWAMNPDTGIAQRRGPAPAGQEIQACAACHSRRGIIHEGMAASPVYLDHYLPSLLDPALYHLDGQIEEEVYVWGSFTQSRMHAAGVTCSDCHDPHSQQLRAPGDAVCAQCHLPTVFATTQHHGHPPESSGADCLACHMPETTYMVVDPRRDHSIRSPRPDQSLEFGTPNACNGCHTDQSVEWAAQAFSTMFPEAGPPFQSWTGAFHQADLGLPQAEVSLLALVHRDSTPDIVRASAVERLAGYLGPLSGQSVTSALQDPSPLVRIAALRVLESVPPANRFALAGPLLDDDFRAVRIEAARVLSGTPPDQLGVNERGALLRGIGEYVASQELLADRPEANLNLGNLYAQTGDAAKAERHYRTALKRDPGFAPAWLNLADLYRAQGMNPEAMKTLRQGLDAHPDDAALHHALGLALVRGGDLPGALVELNRATSLAPDNARFAYVEGVALNSAGRPDEAVKVLTSAHAQHPNDLELLFALASIERDRGNTQAAADWARRMLAVNPADPRADQLLQVLETP